MLFSRRYYLVSFGLEHSCIFIMFTIVTGPLVLNIDGSNLTHSDKIIFPSCQCVEGFEHIPGKILKQGSGIRVIRS